MTHSLDFTKFSKAIKQKRIIDLGIDIRTASSKIGTTASTLSRMENNNMPDLITYANICKWLNVSLDTFIIKSRRINSLTSANK